MSSKVGTSMLSITLHAPEIGKVAHKAMWRLPDGSVAIDDSNELVVIQPEDFFELAHRGGIQKIILYDAAGDQVIIDTLENCVSLWTEFSSVPKRVDWADLVEDGDSLTPMPLYKSDSGGPTTPQLSVEKVEPETGQPIGMSPSTELRAYAHNVNRTTPVPILVGKPVSDHPVLKYLEGGGGTLTYRFKPGDEGAVSVTHKRVRLGRLAFVFDENGKQVPEMDPNRIDISAAPGETNTRLLRSFTMFQ
jgi:hypothetical protein